jgi:hypothetical protein
MKNKTSFIFGTLFLVALVIIGGLAVEKQQLESRVKAVEEKLTTAQKENFDLGNKLFVVSNKIADTASTNQKNINKEDDCAQKAKAAYLDFISDNKQYSNSTYTSHWNILDKACYMQTTVRETLSNGAIVPKGFAVYDLLNQEVKLSCVILSDSEKATAKTCNDSLLDAQRYMFN